MQIPLSFYEYLRNNVRISDVVSRKITLKKKGIEHHGLCPFHQEKTPSFTVNDQKKFYHCFGCNAHGDVIRFVAESTGVTYKQAAITIAEENNIELPQLSEQEQKRYDELEELQQIMNIATDFFHQQLGSNHLEYLQKRNVKRETINQFKIGYAPNWNLSQKFFHSKEISDDQLVKCGLMVKRDGGQPYPIFQNRIMFPIFNLYNKIVAFGGRAIGDAMPKYINSPETLMFHKSKIMYGEHKAISNAYKSNFVILVEGYMDVLALHQAGIGEAAACLGTSLSTEHMQSIWRAAEEVILCLDGDESGQRASRRAIDIALPLISANRKLSFIKLPKGQDPDDIITNNGVNLFNQLLQQKLSLSQTIWHHEYQNCKNDTAEEKAQLEKNLEQYCVQVKDETINKNFRQFFKEQLWQMNSFAKKRQQKIQINTNNVELIASKQYNEIEVIESAICYFACKNIAIILKNDLVESFANIAFKSDTIILFRDWLISLSNDNSTLEYSDILREAKNTSFSAEFLLLLSAGEKFQNLNFLVCEHDLTIAFQILTRRHYLAMLKEDYITISNQELSNINYEYHPENSLKRKSDSYLAEIRKVSKELSDLSQMLN